MHTLDIIYEDTSVLAINKPSGLVVHPFDFSTEVTLLDLIQKYLPEEFSFENVKTLQDGRVINLGGIVHKLDRETSGVFVYAKNKKTWEELSAQFKNHEVKKVYVAYVEGIIEKNNFTINAPLGRNKKSYKQVANPKNPRGELRDAVTDVHVLEHFEKNTLVELTPKTGRTHQLRAHMAYIGHSIIGDGIYGTKGERLLLHAQKLTLKVNNIEKTFTASLSNNFLCPH